MPQYVAIVQLPNEYGQVSVAGGEVVYEAEPEQPRRTGLLNAQGVPLYRMPQPKIIGYDLTPSILLLKTVTSAR